MSCPLGGTRLLGPWREVVKNLAMQSQSGNTTMRGQPCTLAHAPISPSCHQSSTHFRLEAHREGRTSSWKQRQKTPHRSCLVAITPCHMWSRTSPCCNAHWHSLGNSMCGRSHRIKYARPYFCIEALLIVCNTSSTHFPNQLHP